MRRAPADALRALAEMPIAGSPPRLSTHPGLFLAVLRPPSRSALTSNPHSTRCPAGAQLPATSCLGAFRPPASSPRGESVIPAAENLHNNGSRQYECKGRRLAPLIEISFIECMSGILSKVRILPDD